MIEHRETIDKTFGRCLEINNGNLKIGVTLDIGPRIIEFRRIDGENILFEDRKDLVRVSDEGLHDAYTAKDTWHAYGGHRIWRSPETYLSYYPDNLPITYEIRGKQFIFRQKEQANSRILVTLTIEFTGDSTLKVTNTIKNTAPEYQRLSCWALTMVKGPGLEIVPLPKHNSGFTPQRIYSLWGFGAPNNDSRAHYGNSYFTLEMDPENKQAFKIGMKVTDGWSLYLTETDSFIKKFNHDSQALYPDNNVNYETYVRELFLEMETLSPLIDLLPEAEISQVEYWTLLKYTQKIPDASSEAAIEEFMTSCLNSYLL